MYLCTTNLPTTVAIVELHMYNSTIHTSIHALRHIWCYIVIQKLLDSLIGSQAWSRLLIIIILKFMYISEEDMKMKDITCKQKQQRKTNLSYFFYILYFLIACL